MSEDNGQDRRHAATPRRRADARLQGQVPQSRDLSAALMLGGIALLLTWQGPDVMASGGQWLSRSLLNVPVLSGAEVRGLISDQSFSSFLMSAGLLLISLWFVSLIVRLAQVGPMLAPGLVQPRVERVSLMMGVRRLFGADCPSHGFFWLVRVAAVGGLVFWTILHDAAGLSELTAQPVGSVAVALSELTVIFIWRLCGVLIVLAAIDYGWQHWLHERRLRMTDDELRTEHREAERTRTSRFHREQSPIRPFETDGVRSI